jgi:para-nitrobenzyl esterase
VNTIRTNKLQTSRRAFLRSAGTGIAAGAVYSWLSHESLAQNASAGAIIETAAGKVRGSVHNGIHAFKGIQYGAPTGGKMRFMPPAKPVPWTGVRDAFKFGHQSPQNMRYTDVLAPRAMLP